jgi:hypothetical protein
MQIEGIACPGSGSPRRLTRKVNSQFRTKRAVRLWRMDKQRIAEHFRVDPTTFPDLGNS